MTSSTLRRTVTRSALALVLAAGPALALAPAAHAQGTTLGSYHPGSILDVENFPASVDAMVTSTAMSLTYPFRDPAGSVEDINFILRCFVIPTSHDPSCML